MEPFSPPPLHDRSSTDGAGERKPGVGNRLELSARSQEDTDFTLPVPRLANSASNVSSSVGRIRKSLGDLRRAEQSRNEAEKRAPIVFGGNAQKSVDEKVIRDKVALQYSSLFLFPKDNFARIVMFRITHHRCFEALVIMMIFANCFFLGIEDPTLSSEEQPKYLAHMEYVFTSLFAVEMCMKIFSQGFVMHPGSYLRSNWNVLDFAIVALSFLAFAPFFGNVSSVRLARVLRVLSSINEIQGLKNIVNGLLFSVRKLVNVMALAAFLFFIFGIIGVQLLAGRFSYRCQQCLTPDGAACNPDFVDSSLCVCLDYMVTHDNATVDYDRFCKRGAKRYTFIGNFWGRPCDEGWTCVDTGENPHYGFTNFDNIGYAFLVIFQCITMEGWTEIMYTVQDVWGDLGCFYFVMLVVLGSFFVLNLALAVINEQFNNIREETERERAEALERIHRALLLAAETLECEQLCEGDQVVVRDHPEDPWQTGYVVGTSALGPALIHTEDGAERTWLMLQKLDESDAEDSHAASARTGNCGSEKGEDASYNNSTEEHHLEPAHLPLNELHALHANTVPKKEPPQIAPDEKAQSKRSFVAKKWFELRWFCYRLVSWKYFQPFIIICIVVNTAFLASEHHQQPASLTGVFDNANVILTMIFSVEMVLKNMASGLRGYIQDPFNVLDGTVVTMSLIEFAFSGSSTVSVFRALRLLRVFKLLKNFPELRKLIGVCMHAIRDTGYLNLIILLYLFMAALVGKQFFGKDLNLLNPKPRATFNSMYWSLLSVFQILTRDDWVNIMWDAMRSVGKGSSIYFLTLVVCGDFLILNLFLAILIQSFDTSMSTSDNEDDDEGVNEITPPEAILADERARQSLMSDPVVRRASLLFNVVQQQNTAAAAGMGVSTGLSSPFKPHDPEHTNFLPPSHVISAFDLRRTLIKQGSLRDMKEATHIVASSAPHDGASSRRTKVDFTKSLQDEHFAELGEEEQELIRNQHFNKLLNSVQQGESYVCPDCDERVVLPMQLALCDTSASSSHKDVCERIQLRKMRSARLRCTIQDMRCDLKRRSEAFLRSEAYVERHLSNMWEVGLLLEVRVQEWMERPLESILEDLDKQLVIANLRVGEEVVGKGLLSFVSANKPPDLKTNGGNSLCLFGPRNRIRLLCCKIAKTPNFENFILVCIIVSSVMMALENDLSKYSSNFLTALDVCNIVFTSIFVLEMMTKLVAFGLIFGKSDPDPPYLRDSWNIMDGLIVIFSVLSLALASSSSSLDFLKVFRTFRALRPLRVISRNRGLRMVVITLMQSIGGIGNVAVISFLVFLVFGILGVQLLAGQLYFCTDVHILNREACYGWYPGEDGAMTMRRWRNKNPQNFDNIFSSLLTLFEVSTLELWSSIMYSSIDAVSKEHAPIRDNNMYVGLFFVAFVVVGSFFVLNLFVGVVIHNYNEVKVREDGLHFLSGEQKLWIETQRMMLNFKPVVKMVVPADPRRRWIYSLVTTWAFEMVIGACITLNVILMSIEHHNMPEGLTLALETGNWMFSAVFACEAVMKLTAYGVSYFKDSWNRFDFFLVLLSALDVFLVTFQSTGLPINASILRVFRIFRIMRILRLVKAARDVRILLETVWYSLPSIANIGAFLGLLFFIFAIVGVNLFSRVRKGEYLNYHTNFETFTSAILLLFRMVTGENWNGVMRDTMVEYPDCDPNPPVQDCGYSQTAPLYYISFLLMAGFVLTNLFVAIILDNFGTTMQIEKSELRFNDLHKFIDIWADFDPAAQLTIKTLQLPKFLERLGPPLGISRRTSRIEILKRTGNYCIPEHGGAIHFIETIIPLARHVMNEKWQDSLEHSDLRDQEDSWRQAFPDINDLPILRVRQRRVTVDQYFASTYIAAAYRRRRAIEYVNKLKRRERIEICHFHFEQVFPPLPLPLPLFTMHISTNLTFLLVDNHSHYFHFFRVYVPQPPPPQQITHWGEFCRGEPLPADSTTPHLAKPAHDDAVVRMKLRILRLFCAVHGLSYTRLKADIDDGLCVAQKMLTNGAVTQTEADDLMDEMKVARGEGGYSLTDIQGKRSKSKSSRGTAQ